VQHVGDAHREQAHRVGRAPHVQAAQPPGHPELVEQVARAARADLRRRAQQQWGQHVADAAQPRLEAGQRLRVVPGERGHPVVVVGRVTGEQQGPPVGERHERRADRHDLVPVLDQTERFDDGRRHQAHHVRQRGDLEVRAPWRLGGGGAARVAPSLEHERSQAGPGQVGRRHEPVMATADHNHVVIGVQGL
jgi:hypothetical protein